MFNWANLSILLGKLAPFLGLAATVAVGAVAVRSRVRAHRKAKATYSDAVAREQSEPNTLHPFIDPVRCAGCGACVRACPEGEIIQMIEHRAVLVSPTRCVGHGECEVACPFGAISLVFGTKRRGMELPRVTGNYETNVPGLYIAGELGGMGLIRNAVKQGRLAAEHALKSAASGGGSKADVDLLVVGAGAAGLSAGLVAVGAGRRYAIVEQNTVGGTIANFPRQKVVMTQPAELPVVGEMRFNKHKVSKESLLAYWDGVRRRTGLKVTEGCRFLSLTRDERGIFQVETTRGKVTARKVILAMGVRGTPRRLGLKGEDLPKVTYNLIEPDQYVRQRVAVVGGGNAAVEAAQMLAARELGNEVSLLVRSAGLDRCNAENQALIEALEKAGRVRIAYKAQVSEIHPDHLVVERNGEKRRLANDYLFIFAGAEMPFAFLRGLGIKIEKKFGEPLRKG